MNGIAALDLRTSGDVSIAIGDEESLTITTDASTISVLTPGMTDGTLVLDSRDIGFGAVVIRYTLTVRQLDHIRIDGSGDVSGSEVFGDTGSIESLGAGSVSLTGTNTTDLTVTIDGSGTSTLDGTSDSLVLSLDGSGDFDGAQLRVSVEDASPGGGGGARVHAPEELITTVSGSDDLIYTRNPG